MNITIFEAARVITMNPSNPEGTHVAVRDGDVLGVGRLDELTGWGEYTLDRTFADKVLVPGFVEAHAHINAAGMMTLPYMGFFDRPRADGSIEATYYSMVALCLDPPTTGRITRIVQ